MRRTVFAAAFGLAALESTTPRWATGFRTALALATLAACEITFAITLHYQGETLWGVPESTRRNYQELRQRIDRLFSQRTTHKFPRAFSRAPVEIPRAA